MQPLPLPTFAEALKPLLSAPYDATSNPLISSVANNSAKAAPGTLFLAIRGAKADGHRFVKAALAAGASGAVVSGEPEEYVPGKFYVAFSGECDIIP